MRSFGHEGSGAGNAFSAEISGAEIGVVLTGAGPRQAAYSGSKAIRSACESLSFCISAGLAGALRPEYRIGQVLAARGAFSESPREDFNPRTLQSSEPLISFAADCGATVVDQFYSADRVIVRAEEKLHLASKADAVEMESYEILREAAACGIPAVAIRAISDAADEELPLDMNLIFSDEGQVSIPRVMGQVARHPQSLPGLVRLGKQSKYAAESLAGFLDRYVTSVVERARNLELKAAAANR